MLGDEGFRQKKHVDLKRFLQRLAKLHVTSVLVKAAAN